MELVQQVSEILQISELTIENRLDRVSIFGRIDITLDKEGLLRAKQLKDLFNLILAEMESTTLPDKINQLPPDTIKNPLE